MTSKLQELEKSCIRQAIVFPQWLACSNTFWYRRELELGKLQFILVDCNKGLRRVAFDHAGLAAELGKHAEKKINPDKLPFWWINVAPDGAWIRFQFDERTWQYSTNGHLELWHGDFDTGSFDHGCDQVPSPWSRQKSNITFTNHTANRISYSWIDNDGIPQKYGSVSTGQTATQASYVGHIWRLADQDSGKSIVCAVKEKSSIVVIEELSTSLIISWKTDEPSEGSDADGDITSTSTDFKAFVRDSNIWVTNHDGSETQISHDGFEDNKFKELYPSSDGRHVVGWQCTPQSKTLFHLVDSSPKDQLRPKLNSRPGLIPGDNVEIQRPRLFDLVARREIPVLDTLFQNPYDLTNIGWSKDGQKYRFIFNERGHHHLRVLEIGLNGTVTVLAEDNSKTFVDYAHKLYYKIMETTNELLWASERDGWNHLYLLNLDDGSLKNQVTKGSWVMRSVERVDEAKRQVWFSGFGMVPGQDPYYSHLARVDFDGSNLCIVTEGDGSHTWNWGPNKEFLIDSWSRVDCPPQVVLRVAETGKEVVSLEKGHLEPLLEAGWAPPETFVAPGRDGQTNIHGIIIRPQEFDATKKYPILERIYAGPQSFYTPKAFQSLPQLRRHADQGYILVCLDGMGTNWRSKAFHDVCYKNLKDGGFPDRISWIRAASETRPWMDVTRVGCYGTSAGGQNAAAAVIHHSDFYKAASALAGCHDNRMDKLWWNELWMGYPVDHSYQDSSNITHADKLGGALMLAVGGMDMNVDPSVTLRLANALIEADKDFDLVFIPGGGHDLTEMPFVVKKLNAFFQRHLKSC